MRQITFGTSGWRAVLGEDFTFQSVRIVAQAIVHVLKQEKIGHRGLIIGYDARFLGEKFAKVAAEVFAGHGMSVLLCDRGKRPHQPFRTTCSSRTWPAG